MARTRIIALAVSGVLAITAPAATDERAVQTEQDTIASLTDVRAIMNGYRRYNATCNHCHGPDGVGSSFARSLIETPMGIEPFREVVRKGSASGVSVMNGFENDPNVADHIDDIYVYLMARAKGTVGRGRPKLGN